GSQGNTPMEKKKRERRKTQDPIGDSGADGKKPPNFFVVGIGASAGGLQALRSLFSRMRSDSGMAFVVILHLSPQFKTTLAELLQKEPSMAVTHVEGAVRLEPNHVYVISPNQNLMLEDGLIQAFEASSTPGARVPVDLFFRSLGDAYRKNSIAVVL